MSALSSTETLPHAPAKSSNVSIPGSPEEPAGPTPISAVVVPGKPAESLLLDDTEPLAERRAAEDESQYPTGLKFALILVSISIVLIFGALNSSIVAVALPAITDEFHTVADLGWYSSASRLSMCSTQFLFGKLYKIFSVKLVFITSTFISLVSVVLCATAPTSAAFVLGRAVDGLGTAGVISGAFTLLVQCLPLRKRPLYLGVFGAIEGVALMSGPSLGGAIVDKLGWRWCFWISVPGQAVTLIAVWFCLSDVKPAVQLSWRQRLSELDLLGTAVFIPSLTCLFMALGWAGTRYAWNSPTIIGLLCTFAVLLGFFAYEQYRKGDQATLPPRILGNRSVMAGFMFAVCCNSAMNVIEYYLPTYFQTVRQFSAARSGYLIFPVVAGFIVSMLLAGWGVSKVGYYTPFMIAGSLLMPIFAGLLTTIEVDTPLSTIICYATFYGFAGGIGFQSPQSGVQTALPEADASIGLSIIIFAQQFGPAVAITIAQSIFTNKLSQNLQEVAPGVNSTTIEAMGLTDIQGIVGPENLNNVLLGFDRSLIQTWYLAVALTCATMIGSLAMEWRSVKHKKQE